MIVKALLLSFHLRRAAEGGGTVVSRNFQTIVQRVHGGPVVDVFQDDPVGRVACGDILIRVERWSRPAKLWRLIVRAEVGRLRFRFASTHSVGCGAPRPDLVIDGVGFADVLERARGLFGKSIVLHHNFEPDYYRDAYFRKPLARWYVRAGLKAECTALQTASLNLFLTRQDLEKSRGACGEPRGRAEVFGVYEPVTALRPVQRSDTGPLRVLISGNLEMRKGHLGLVEMLTIVQRERSRFLPKLQFVVAGGHPTPEVMALDDGSLVEVIANPASIADLAQTCDIYLNPNFTGSGIKIRNFDGLRNGLAVLCRRENAAGFDDLEPFAFQTFSTSEEGLARLEALRPAQVRSAHLRERVWQTYATRFDLAAGVMRLRSFCESIEAPGPQ